MITKTPEAKPTLKIVPKITPIQKTKITIKTKTPNTESLSLVGTSTDESMSVDDSSSVSVDTYITPVYGVNMRVSLDNKYIYDMDFNLVGTVQNNKSIEWVDD
jgi:hypothetical protein